MRTSRTAIARIGLRSHGDVPSSRGLCRRATSSQLISLPFAAVGRVREAVPFTSSSCPPSFHLNFISHRCQPGPLALLNDLLLSYLSTELGEGGASATAAATFRWPAPEDAVLLGPRSGPQSWDPAAWNPKPAWNKAGSMLL